MECQRQVRLEESQKEFRKEAKNLRKGFRQGRGCSRKARRKGRTKLEEIKRSRASSRKSVAPNRRNRKEDY